jgi:small subunit ribosomal protein S5
VNLFPFAPFGSPEGQEEELPAPDATLRTDNEGEEGSSSSGETSSSRFPDRFANLPYSSKFLSSLYRFPLIRKRVVQQTSKGKIPRMFALVVVGNGDGLVGFGQGKDEGTPKAMDKAFSAAVKRLDYVDRFEDRTIWTTMEMKLGATRVVMRPRPVGFGLMVNPYVHQVCKAAGIRDLSAKVYGSRNGMQIVKAVMMMLQGGSTPLGMGDGIGGKGKREEAKEGMRGREVVERERGRRLVEGTGWL